MIIMRPYICYEILHQLKIMSNVNTKVDIVEKLNWLVNRIHTNAYIITNKSTLKDITDKQVSFMNELIDILVENNRVNQFTEKLLIFIEKVIHLSGLKIKYIKHTLEKISESFIKTNYDSQKFLLLIKLLNVIYSF